MTPERAYVVAAQLLIAQAAERIDWEDLPNTSEWDWEKIDDLIGQLATWPDLREQREALELLEKRAGDPAIKAAHGGELPDGTPYVAVSYAEYPEARDMSPQELIDWILAGGMDKKKGSDG